MLHQETFDAFIEGINSEQSVWGYKNMPMYLNFFVHPNSTDLFIYPNIPSDVKHAIRMNWGIDLGEEILYVRDSSFWNECNQGLVITDCGVICIPDNDDVDDRTHILWENVDHVEYKDEILYFFGYGVRDNNCPIHISHFLKNATDETKQGAGEIFQRIFTRMAQTQVKESRYDIYKKTADQVDHLMAIGKKEEALQLALKYRDQQQDAALTREIAWLYHGKGQDDKAIQILEEDINSTPIKNTKLRSFLAYQEYSIYDNNKDYFRDNHLIPSI